MSYVKMNSVVIGGKYYDVPDLVLARIAELEAALEEIRDYPSSQPLALNVPDEDWQRMRSREISAIAWQALEESK